MGAGTITARVDPQAITRVTRFFNAGIRQTVEELLQNARRSGASSIDIWIDGNLLTISDDGAGIADPQALLTFGSSTWKDDAVRREDPAGMGVYALARRASAIASKTADGDGWRVELEGKHFRGEEPAMIEPCEMPKPGTAVTLTLQPEEPETTVREQVECAGRYHPLPIRFNGNPIEREDFLARATHTLEWEGLRIGVFKESARAESGLNFHGVRIQLGDWPRVATGEGSWTACADVVDAPKFELTLPARHDVVRTISPSRCTRGCTRRSSRRSRRCNDPHTWRTQSGARPESWEWAIRKRRQ